LGGVRVYLVEVTFRLDEHDDQSGAATQACFEELGNVWGVSDDTGKLWHQDWSKSVYPVENGIFVATLLPIPPGRLAKNFLSCCRMFLNNASGVNRHTRLGPPYS
jgi:hypothetical protein